MIDGLLVALHVFANLIWIGSIASVGWLTAQARELGDNDQGRSAGRMSLALYRRFATPAFVCSLLFGVSRLLMAPASYMHLHWFHGKLTFALGVIALHHVIGAQAKKVSSGSMQGANNSAILTLALFVCAFVTVSFATFLRLVFP